jgi:hypothetical protein
MRGQHLADGTERPAAEFAGHGIGSVDIGINHAHQANGFPLLLEFLINAGVVAPKHADPNHRDRNRTRR